MCDTSAATSITSATLIMGTSGHVAAQTDNRAKIKDMAYIRADG
jgi:hypothetical protein